MMETDEVKGLVERVTQEEIVKAMKNVKSGKAAGLLEVGMEMIVEVAQLGLK